MIEKLWCLIIWFVGLFILLLGFLALIASYNDPDAIWIPILLIILGLYIIPKTRKFFPKKTKTNLSGALNQNLENICTNCYCTKPAIVPGSFLIEIILWCFMVLPGLIYTIWRKLKNNAICPSCGKNSLIPIDTPKGQELFKHTKMERSL